MKNTKTYFRNLSILCLAISSFVACDKDYATIGSDIIGDNNFNTNRENYEVISYNKKVNPVQTNGLPTQLFGVYKDPFYGLTTATIVAQMGTNTFDPDFGDNTTLDSVVLTIPYFSKTTGTDEEGNTTFALDSIFPNVAEPKPIKISIYENKYFLRNFDPNAELETAQKFYSNKSTSANSAIDQAALEGTLLHTDNYFTPSNKQINLRNNDLEITDRLAPSMRIKLDKTFWQEKIIDKEGSTELKNLNNFQNYFRGLYLKAENLSNDGSMLMLNLGSTSANITLYYSKDPASTTSTDRVNSTYILTFSGTKATFFDNQFNVPLVDGNSTMGDERLYLKGGEGSLAHIALFEGEDIDEDNNSLNSFEEFKNTYVETDENGKFVKAKRLINDAQLIFSVDQSAVQGQEPDRIYLYDSKNNTVLLDYVVETGNTVSANNSRVNHLGKLVREDNTATGQGIKYKLKITEHINNLLLRDSTNVKLGLAVSTNINLEEKSLQRDIQTADGSNFKAPNSSVLSPRGTVLFGNNTTAVDKKVQLVIYYTCLKTDGDCTED